MDNIFNRPPAIAEDTLEYALYPPTTDKASATTFAACIQSFVHSLLPDFIWHRDPFQLKVSEAAEGSGEWILDGRMRVGDCADDEWCTVWLFREISSKWDVAISVFDSDGEFLLIEAADTLPTWVKPTNSENRVWIYNSRLHLVPISHISPPSRTRRRRQLPGSNDSDDDDAEGITAPTDDDEYLAVEDAVRLVRDPNVDTFAAQAIEQTVWKRIAGYPNAIQEHTHTTKAYIPLDIARALSTNPSLVQKPVETFYTRDALQLRMAHRMARFPPEPSVLRTVRMTRTAYAQLVGQKFFSPKIFGKWTEKEGTSEWRWRDVGMKLASGFEMTYQESKSRSDNVGTTAEALNSSAEARKEALRRNPDYVKYIENLVSVDYFRGEIAGSQLWSTLENKAADVFVEARRRDDATRQSFASLMNEAISKTNDMAITASMEEEDSEAWLSVDSDNFDAMLEDTMGNKNKTKTQPEGAVSDAMQVDGEEEEEREQETAEDRLANDQASRLKSLAAKVEEFVEGEGDIEGARFEDEEFSEEEFSDGDMSEDSSDDSPDSPHDKDRQAAMDALVPGLAPTEYGTMPASFHANSQRVAPTTIETEVIEEVISSPAAEATLASQEPPPAAPRARPVRQPIIPRDRYDGVDSDDETDSEEDDARVDEEEDEDDERPQVVGDVEIDMEQEEQEFLEFSRQALGISDGMWEEIVRDRKGRGAFVPAGVEVPGPKAQTAPAAKPEPAVAKETLPARTPAPGPRPNVNPNLDSFEAVMLAMDEELARSRTKPTKTPKPKTTTKKPEEPKSDVKGKGKQKATVEDAMDDDDDDDNGNEQDIEMAMDAELRAALDREVDEEEEGRLDGEEPPMDYNLIKNFLESFKSQAGLAGPVGNLVGRLDPGWKLPRDEA